MASLNQTFAALSVAAAAAAITYTLWLRRTSLKGSGVGIPAVILVDNGSLRATSTLSLRAIAGKVAAASPNVACVAPTSMRFSDRVPAAELAGVPAELLAPAFKRLYAAGTRRFIILPAFISATEAIEERMKTLAAAAGGATYVIARPLVDVTDGSDTRIARALIDRAEAARVANGISRCAVAVCDHGSPSPDVTEARHHVMRQVAALLADSPVIAAVGECSMERRPEPQYDFNEPTLDKLLMDDSTAFATQDVVVTLMFISPGRHAGEGGDIATIIAAAPAVHDRRVVMTDVLGLHPLVLQVFADRVQEAMKKI